MSSATKLPATPSALIFGIAEAASRLAAIPKVYPSYLAFRAKKGLLDAQAADPERIIAEVGEVQTIGDCRYAIPVTDCHGTRYRITVEVLPPAGQVR